MNLKNTLEIKFAKAEWARFEEEGNAKSNFQSLGRFNMIQFQIDEECHFEPMRIVCF